MYTTHGDGIVAAMEKVGLTVVTVKQLQALETLASAFIEYDGNETDHGQVFGEEEFRELIENSGLDRNSFKAALATL